MTEVCLSPLVVLTLASLARPKIPVFPIVRGNEAVGSTRVFLLCGVISVPTYFTLFLGHASYMSIFPYIFLCFRMEPGKVDLKTGKESLKKLDCGTFRKSTILLLSQSANSFIAAFGSDG